MQGSQKFTSWLAIHSGVEVRDRNGYKCFAFYIVNRGLEVSKIGIGIFVAKSGTEAEGVERRDIDVNQIFYTSAPILM